MLIGLRASWSSAHRTRSHVHPALAAATIASSDRRREGEEQADAQTQSSSSTPASEKLLEVGDVLTVRAEDCVRAEDYES